MEFSKVGEHTVRCMITEKEITDLGYTIDEIMVNGQKTQEFMEHIFQMAQEKCQVSFDSGIRTVRADLRPDHTLVLTFSQHTPEGLMEHLKDLVGDIVEKEADNGKNQNSAENGKKRKSSDLSAVKEKISGETPEIIVLLEFAELDLAIRFAKQLPEDLIPKNALYKYKKKYYIRVDLTDFSQEEVTRLSMITDEYVEVMLPGSARSAFIEEHGEVLIRKAAIEELRKL